MSVIMSFSLTLTSNNPQHPTACIWFSTCWSCASQSIESIRSAINPMNINVAVAVSSDTTARISWKLNFSARCGDAVCQWSWTQNRQNIEIKYYSNRIVNHRGRKWMELVCSNVMTNEFSMLFESESTLPFIGRCRSIRHYY